jgi:predicted ATPase
MKLKLIKISKLHGYINTEFDLDDDLALIVGINGAGKTSTLNAINWMLNLDMGRLCTESFDEISISFENEGLTYIYSAIQDEDHLVIDVKNLDNGFQYPIIEAVLNYSPKQLSRLPVKKNREYENLQSIGPDEAEIETWEFILSLPSPIIIGLDRTLYTTKNRQTMVDRRDYLSFEESNGRKLTPLQIVSKLLESQYAIHNSELLKLNRILNETILLSSFDKVYTKDKAFEVLNQPVPSALELKDLEEKVIQFLKDNNNWNSNPDFYDHSDGFQNIPENTIRRYFSDLRKVFKNKVKEGEGYDLAYLLNLSQINKVNKLADAFSDFEIRTQTEIEPLDEFMDIINGFFVDSAKKLYFVKGPGSLKYNVIDKAGSIIQKGLNINLLSSGEKQILILLTYVKYRKETLFLIDEPELSLHVKWQEEFLNAIERLRRSDTQLIIATHSPEIIGEYRSNCKILNPYS